MVRPMKRSDIFVKRIFTENKGLKLLAFVISISLFLAVRAQEKVERWVDVDVEVILPDDSSKLALTNRPITTVRVHIKGRETLLDAIRSEGNHVVKMDLSNRVKPGMSTFFFEPDMFKFGSGVEIVGINPEAVSIRMEKIVTRRLPVRVKTVGSLKKGTEFKDDPVVTPNWVKASGPTSVIRSVTLLMTEEVGIDDLAPGEYNEEVPLVPVDGLEYELDRFKVNFQVVQTEGQRMLSGLLVRSGVDGEKSVRAVPSEVAVSLAGPQLSLNKLNPASIVPTFVLEEEQLQKSGKYRLKVLLQGIPDDIEVMAIVPSYVMVEVSD